MSDSQVVIVDLGCEAEVAAERGEALRSWLLAERIIVDKRFDPPWYPPNADLAGPQWGITVAASDRGYVPSGVEIDTVPLVYTGVENIGLSATCPACGVEFDTDRWVGIANDVLTGWVNGSGVDAVPCPSCQAQHRVSQWQWRDGEPWAVGNLGIVFWNWPPLLDSFVDQVRRQLGTDELCVINVHI